jgi:hypothetical protein
VNRGSWANGPTKLGALGIDFETRERIPYTRVPHPCYVFVFVARVGKGGKQRTKAG